MINPNELENLFDRLWPLNRSLTGNDNRNSLKILSEISNINISEVPSGSKILDWIVPPEYEVKKAFVETEYGETIIDFKDNNLHLVTYSHAIDEILSFDELAKKINFIEEMPNAIPYVTSYYDDNWGFCMTFNQFKQLRKDIKYRVVIDSSKNFKGSMTVGQRVLKGKIKKEILISSYICHPSMANNELSGPLLTVFLQRKIERMKDRYFTYRFVYVPETIGAIHILNEYGSHFKKYLYAGLVATCVGDCGIPTYKKSRRGDTDLDRLTNHILLKNYEKFKILDFFPTGSDERQYCSPAFNLPVGSLMRTMYTCYPEYHTSMDNKSILDFKGMVNLIETYFEIITHLKYLKKYKFTDGKGEPFLRGKSLISGNGGKKEVPKLTQCILWCLSLSDGIKDTLDIAEITNFDLLDIYNTCQTLEKNNLLIEIQ